ncbi:MAG: segregation/condensation protein A [Patescibacteria group bacterium]
MSKAKYHVKVKEFEGPLELLLDLIETRKLSINEVALGVVTEEYFKHLNVIKEDPENPYHEEIAIFLVVAATLMLIKSRSLLPGFMVTDEEKQDIRELEDRLKAYKIIKEMSRQLGEITESRRPLFSRAPYVMIAPSFLPPSKPLDIQKLFALLQNIIETIPKKHELPEKTVTQVISIEEKMQELEKRVQEGLARTFSELIQNKADRFEIVVSFLAMLELIKIGSVAVQQGGLFGTIHINHGTSKEN